MTHVLPPWEPPFAGGEAEHLVGMLQRLRATFRWKADALTTEQLRVRIGASELSIGTLLKHLALVEDEKFAWCIDGERPVTRGLAPAGVDVRAWQFTLTEADTAASLYALWDAAAARTDAKLSDIFAQGRLDTPAHVSFEGIQPSIRRFICDLIEEYGRHTGHADLIREAIDGRVGEDPPSEWRRPWRTDPV